MNDVNLPPEATQLLNQMHNIKEPDPVSWWPLAPGWWLLIGLTAALLCWLAYKLVRRAKQNRYRKEALALLAKVAAQPEQHSVTDINEIIKRTALHAYPRERPEIARNYGERWVQWLNSKCSAPVITGTAADALAHDTYKADASAPLKTSLEAARRWVQRHSTANTRGADANA